MTERMIFNESGLIKDKTDKAEIEFWGHDAGEFSPEEIEEILAVAKEVEKEKEATEA